MSRALPGGWRLEHLALDVGVSCARTADLDLLALQKSFGIALALHYTSLRSQHFLTNHTNFLAVYKNGASKA